MDRFDLARKRKGKDVFVKSGRKGGLKTGYKGMAVVKAEDPERFKAIYKKGKRGRPKKIDNVVD